MLGLASGDTGGMGGFVEYARKKRGKMEYKPVPKGAVIERGIGGGLRVRERSEEDLRRVRRTGKGMVRRDKSI